jgi:TRAP-type C4-dicarboxylate transport system permease large subunit
VSFYVKLAAFCAVFAIVFAIIGLIFDQPVGRMAIAGVVPGLGVGFGYLTVRERDARKREHLRRAAAEDDASQQTPAES